MIEKKKVVCIQCHTGCRQEAHIEDGKLIGVGPDLDFPKGEAFASIVRGCPRAAAIVDYFYHPGRLNYPLKRAGARGENKWVQISWDQALDEIAGKMQKLIDMYGPETIGSTAGTGRTTDEFRWRFLNLLGSPNMVGQGEICYGEYLALMYAMFGWKLFPVVRAETQCVLIWGGGGPRYWNVLWRNIIKAHKAGGIKVIVIDPRGIDATQHADLWLRVRPGTDGALAMGMIRYVIEHELYDKAFVQHWCFGFDELRARVQPYTLERVSEITWIPQEKIKQAVEWYTTLKPAAMTHGIGIEHPANAMETLHAVFALRALTGNIDVKGGDVFTTAYPDIIHEQEIELHDKLSPEQAKKQLGSDRFRILSCEGFTTTHEFTHKAWGKEMVLNRSGQFQRYAHAPSFYRAALTGKPYPLKGIVTLSSNPVVTQANSKLVYEALKALDLYVVVDFFMTPSGQLADYVLPGTTYLERPWIWSYAMIVGSERAMPAIVPGKYERWTDYKVWKGLGDRLGQKEYWPWEDLEEVYDYRLKPSGMTFKEFMAKGGVAAGKGGFKRYEANGFGTSTGKVELYSKALEKLGYDPLPEFREPPESPVSTPELAKEYPFVLTTGGRFLPYYNSEHRQIERHRKRYPWPIMEMHPDAAKKLGINDGDWVWLESPRGRCRQVCKHTESIDPRVVHAQHGWWYPEDPGEEPSLHGLWKSNINALTDDDPDICNALNGGWPL
ncbi:MAG TPA: molybdopterin-dependent oxidoreductase, partial [Thermodesulfobacteriota bacterium]|nr:molybdopterin-dependent oxidoreductase [Thermodesulfobacteriota bacterium]